MPLAASWNALSPKTRQMVLLGGALGVIIVMATIATLIAGGDQRARPKDTTLDVDVMMPDTRNLTMEDFAAQLLDIKRRMGQNEEKSRLAENKVEETLSEIRNMVSGKGQQSRLTEIEARLNQLDVGLQSVDRRIERQVEAAREDLRSAAQAGGVSVGGAGGAGTGVPPPGGADGAAGRPGLRQPPGAGDAVGQEDSGRMRVVRPGERNEKLRAQRAGGSASAGDIATARPVPPPGGIPRREEIADAQTGEDQDVYLPPGAMMEGVLLNGMEAPTTQAAQRNPIPALIRLKTEAILPNYASIDLTECFALASGHGRLATERVEMRLERLTCVRGDMKVIDERLNGYIVSSYDGKVGIGGRLITRFGQYIARSAAYGILSGIGEGLAPQNIGISVADAGESGSYFPNMSEVMRAGIATGASKSLDKVADFYLDLAEEAMPVISVDAGRVVQIVILQGTSLKLQG